MRVPPPNGVFAIPWTQCHIESRIEPPLHDLVPGTSWSWSGETRKLDEASMVLMLHNAMSGEDLRSHAARSVRKLLSSIDGVSGRGHFDCAPEELVETGFVLTGISGTYIASLIGIDSDHPPLVIFLGRCPPRKEPLTVVQVIGRPRRLAKAVPAPSGVICFVPGTRVWTPLGEVPVEHLEQGDLVLTKDNGPQPLIWTGQGDVSGARLHATPALRPIRFRSDALGTARPQGDLLVSPEHRVLVKGSAADMLFGQLEVLVAAKDLVNDTTIQVDHSLRRVRYHHLMLERHEVLWANGLETESFHPADMALDRIDPGAQVMLRDVLGEVADDPIRYGSHSRRTLTAGEAAILMHDTKLRL